MYLAKTQCDHAASVIWSKNGGQNFNKQYMNIFASTEYHMSGFQCNCIRIIAAAYADCVRLLGVLSLLGW